MGLHFTAVELFVPLLSYYDGGILSYFIIMLFATPSHSPVPLPDFAESWELGFVFAFILGALY